MEKEDKSIGFTLMKITTEQFALIQDSFTEGAPIRIRTNIRFGVENITKMIAVFASFTYESNEKPFIIIEAGCHFQINEDAWNDMFSQDENALTVARGFMSHLTVLTVGTVRGILHAKTESTPFNRFVLPTINITELIKDDVIIACMAE